MPHSYSQDHWYPTRNICNIASVLIMALAIVTPTISCTVNAGMTSDQSGLVFQKLWGGDHNTPGGEGGTSVAVDSIGNIYATGHTASFGPGNLSAHTAVFLLKYDPTGILVWKRIWSGNGSNIDHANAVAVDSSGNIYVTGWTFSFGAGMGDILLLKFNSSGDLVWQRTYGGSDDDQGSSVAVDSSGNIYVTGGIRGFGRGSDDLLLLKFDSTGSLLWQKTWGDIPFDYGVSVTADSLGYIYVTGTTESERFGTGLSYLILLKFNSSGSLVWQKVWGPSYPSFATGHGVAVDSSSNVYVTGYYANSIEDNILDILLLKFNSTGSLTWKRTWDSGSWDRAEDVAVDSSGGIYVTGCVLVQSGYDVLLVKFDSSGNHAGIVTWGNNDPGHSQKGYGVAVDSSGDPVVTGFVDFGPPYTINYPKGTIGAPSLSLSVPNFTLDTPTFQPYIPNGVVQTPPGSEDNTGKVNNAFVIKFTPLGYTQNYSENPVDVFGVPPIVFYGLVGGAAVIVALAAILLRRRRKTVTTQPTTPPPPSPSAPIKAECSKIH